MALAVSHHLDHVRIVPLCQLSNRGLDGRHGRDRRTRQGGNRVLDHSRRKKRQVSLYVDDHFGAEPLRDLGQAIGPGRMVGARHPHFPAKPPHCLDDTFVVSGDDHPRQAVNEAGPLVDVLDHGLATEQRQGFARKAA